MSEIKGAQVLNLQNVEKDKVLVEIQVPAERVNKAIETVYRDIAKKIRIDGFRPGKAPRKIVEMRVGKDYFYAEAQKELLTPAFIEVLNQTNIKPLSSELKDVFIEENKPMVFKIEIQKEPIFDVKEYEGIEVKGAPVEVATKEVDDKIEELRQRYAKLEPVTDRTAETGDFAMVDYRGYIGEVEAKSVKGDGVMIEIGSKKMIAGLEDGIIGMTPGTEKDVNLKYPENYHNSEYAGKDVRFHIVLKELKKKTLPELNDDFAKRLGEFNTFEELKSDVLKKLTESKEEHQKMHFKEQMCEHLIAKNPQIEVSEIMVDKELDRIINNYELQFMYRRMDLHSYLKSIGQSLEDFRQHHRDAAVRNVKISTLLSSIAEHEKITSSEEEVTSKIQQTALSVGRPYADVRKHLEEEGNLIYMKEEIVHQKVFDVLISRAKITIDPDYKCEHEHSHDEDSEHEHSHEA